MVRSTGQVAATDCHSVTDTFLVVKRKVGSRACGFVNLLGVASRNDINLSEVKVISPMLVNLTLLMAD
jgi:hypothetical protein